MMGIIAILALMLGSVMFITLAFEILVKLYNKYPVDIQVSVAVFCISVSLFFGGLFFVDRKQDELAQINIREEQAWIAAGCPVYKAECGGKSKFACELKGAVVGRNKVGDIFVEAYPICKK